MEIAITPIHVRRKADEMRVTLGAVLARAGVQRSTFWRWEEGVQPRNLTLLKIQDALDAIAAERAA